MKSYTKVKCKHCKIFFEKLTWHFLRSTNHFCSRECSRLNSYVPCKCDYCGKNFSRRKGNCKNYKKLFCNAECRKASINSKTFKRKCNICEKEFTVKNCNSEISIYCSRECSAIGRNKQKEINCTWCSKTVLRTPSQLKKSLNVFCSCSCRAKYNIRQRQGFRRSYGEKFLSELIQKDFPNYKILENKKNLLPSGYEIDIFIENKNLAIELNGPCHYFNIYGEKTLQGVQTRDAIKHAEIQQAGFGLIILNISTISDRKKLEKFISEQYEVNIKPIL